MTPAGRRSGNPDTRAEILDAAREIFATSGYRAATIRSIAESAGVDPALVHHYFGTKDQLFAASIALPYAPGDLIEGIVEGSRGEIGHRLATVFFSVWENPAARASLLGMLRTAMTGNEQAILAFREFILEELRDRLAESIAEPDAELRAVAIASHLIGVAITRYVVKLEPISTIPIEELVDLVAPRLQSYLD